MFRATNVNKDTKIQCIFYFLSNIMQGVIVFLGWHSKDLFEDWLKIICQVLTEKVDSLREKYWKFGRGRTSIWRRDSPAPRLILHSMDMLSCWIQTYLINHLWVYFTLKKNSKGSVCAYSAQIHATLATRIPYRQNKMI